MISSLVLFPSSCFLASIKTTNKEKEKSSKIAQKKILTLIKCSWDLQHNMVRKTPFVLHNWLHFSSKIPWDFSQVTCFLSSSLLFCPWTCIHKIHVLHVCNNIKELTQKMKFNLLTVISCCHYCFVLLMISLSSLINYISVADM